MKTAQKTELYKQDGIASGVIPDESRLFESAASDQAEDLITLVSPDLMKEPLVCFPGTSIECEMVIVECIALLVDDPSPWVTEYYV